MKEAIILFFSTFDPNWAVFWISMFPITELRASIPVGIEVFKLPVWRVWILAVIGDMVPTLFILSILPYVHDWVVKQSLLGPIVTKKLNSAEKKFAGDYKKYGPIALIIFVGIPLPMTGAWTGSLAAFLFNIPFKKSVPLLFVGVCLAATVVTGLTLFAEKIIGFFV